MEANIECIGMPVSDQKNARFVGTFLGFLKNIPVHPSQRRKQDSERPSLKTFTALNRILTFKLFLQLFLFAIELFTCSSDKSKSSESSIRELKTAIDTEALHCGSYGRTFFLCVEPVSIFLG